MRLPQTADRTGSSGLGYLLSHSLCFLFKMYFLGFDLDICCDVNMVCVPLKGSYDGNMGPKVAVLGGVMGL